MKRIFSFLGIAAVLIFCIPVFSSAFDFSQVENRVVEFTLKNGLKFLVYPDDEAPVVYIRTLVKVGGVNDPKGAAGIAHMFEHMAFKGTEEIGTKNLKMELKWMAVEDSLYGLILAEKAKREKADPARMSELEAKMKEATDSAVSYVVTNEWGEIYGREGGVELNAGTGYDQTLYIANYPANRLELWMAMESQRFTRPVLREFYKEKDVIAEERRMSRESSPQGKLQEELISAAFIAHPYGQSLIGPMSDIQNYYRPEAEKFFKKYYVPNNMVIGIAGDVDPAHVKMLAEKYFGKIPAGPKPKPELTIEPPQNGERTVIVKDNAQPVYFSAFHIPDINHPDFPALDALAEYLGAGRTSPLYKTLVKDKKIAVAAQAFAGFPGSYYPTLFGILSVPSKDHTNAESDAEILKIIEKVKSEPIPADELEKIKARAKANFVNQISNTGGWMGIASQLAYYETFRDGWRNLFKELDKINALTAEDIQRVAREYLDVSKRTVAMLEPLEE